MRYPVAPVIACLMACGAGARDTRPRSTLGTIAGLARDTVSGDGVATAEITVGTHATTSDKNGQYQIDGIKPGVYTLVAHYAGQPVTISNIDVTAGLATFVDVPFTLGQPGPVTIDFRSTGDEIEHFRTKVPRIEGTVSDAKTRERVVGAVVTAVGNSDALQTVTDDSGRYRFDAVAPATYTISAYYSVGGRGQIEVRRSDIVVGSGEGVLVPLYIEMTKR